MHYQYWYDKRKNKLIKNKDNADQGNSMIYKEVNYGNFN